MKLIIACVYSWYASSASNLFHFCLWSICCISYWVTCLEKTLVWLLLKSYTLLEYPRELAHFKFLLMHIIIFIHWSSYKNFNKISILNNHNGIWLTLSWHIVTLIKKEKRDWRKGFFLTKQIYVSINNLILPHRCIWGCTTRKDSVQQERQCTYPNGWATSGKFR